MAFPGLSFDEEEAEKDIVEYIYIDEDAKDAWEIFDIAKKYLGDYYRIDPTLVVKLIENRNLPLEKLLHEVADLHYGFSSILLEDLHKDLDNGRE